MAYTNSPLVVYTQISPNKTENRNHAIDTITIHCMAGNLSVETCGRVFANPARQASSNYGIGSDGRIAMYAEEKSRSWCTSSKSNDHRAVTIEVANDGGAETGWHVSDRAMAALIDLCADICRRNGIKELKWLGDKKLIGQVDKQNMTVHRWFAAKACPGDYLYGKHPYIAAEVNKRLEVAAAAQSQPPAGTGAGAAAGSSAAAGAADAIPLKIDSNIKAVQIWLNTYYSAGLAVDGSFGSLSKKALIKAWQKEVGGLTIDGAFGSACKAAAAKCNIRKGDKGILVTIWQAYLVCAGYNPNGIDGSFGAGCAAATSAWQRANGLTSDAVVGSNTWYKALH